MATYLSDRALRKIERDRRKEEERFRRENEIRKHEKEEKRKHRQELKEKEQLELQKQRERLLHERRKHRERKHITTEIDENIPNREEIENERKHESEYISSSSSETGEEYMDNSKKELAQVVSHSYEEKNERSLKVKTEGNESNSRVHGDNKTMNRKTSLHKERQINDTSLSSTDSETDALKVSQRRIENSHRKETLKDRDMSTDTSDSGNSEDSYETVDETYDRDYLNKPKYNSTDIENDDAHEIKYEDEMRWLDDKYEQYQGENAELRSSIDEIRNTEIVKETRRKDSDKESKYRTEENKLEEKIEQLKIREKRITDAIEENKILRQIQAEEKDKLKHRQKEAKKQNERRQLEKKKLEKLKEEEMLLKRRIKDKEANRESKNSVHTDKPVEKAREFTKKLDKDRQSDSWKGKLHKPNIPSLTETTFEEWKIEVEIILKSGLYEENILRQAIRNSLCGHTRKILLTVNPEATSQQIIDKLESIYGNIRSGESVLSEFYMSKQGKEENVSEWGLRLESILQRAKEKGHIKEEQREEMLKVRFWRHLYNEDLKNATRLCFETSKSFEELRRKVRVEENEMMTARQPESALEDRISLHQHKGEDDRDIVMKTVLERMERLEKELLRVKDKSREENSPSKDGNRYTDLESGRSRWDRKERDRYDRGNYRSRYRDYAYRDRRGYRGGYLDRNDRDRQDKDYNRYGSRYDDRERRDVERYPRENRYLDRGYRQDKGNTRSDDRYGYDRERNYSDRNRQSDERSDRYRGTENRLGNKDCERKITEEEKVSEKSEEKVKGEAMKQDNKQVHQEHKTDTTSRTNTQNKHLNH